MRLWVQTYTNTAATPSAALSVAAHVVLIGAAVYGTGRPAVGQPEAESSRVYYLPPPDRKPHQDDIVEHLQFIDVGAGALAVPATSPTGTPVGTEKGREDAAGAHRLDAANTPPRAREESQDSIYSVLSVEESAVRWEGSAAPIYPPEMLAKNIEGAVLTRYIIDTTGRADSASLQVLSATNTAFMAAVREALPGMRFSPAVVQGRKVRQLVEQNFEFRLQPPVTAPAEHTRAKPVP